MKIIIPVTKNIADQNEIALGFHNAKNLCIYDSDKNTFDYLNASQIADEDIDLTISLKYIGVSAVISQTLPRMALSMFTGNGFNVFKAQGADLNKNIKLFLNKKLEPFSVKLSNPRVGCGESCESCDSTCS